MALTRKIQTALTGSWSVQKFTSDSSEGRGRWHSTLNGMGRNAETGSPDKLVAILQRYADTGTHMGPFTQYHIPNEIDEVDTCAGNRARAIQVMKLTEFYNFFQIP